MVDKIIGKTESGKDIYEDETGDQFIVIDGPSPRGSRSSRSPKKEADKKEADKKEADKKINKEENMADENITKLDILKEKVEGLKENFNSKIQEGEKRDIAIEQKQRVLDAKQCEGEKCLDRVEKSQQDQFKMLEERLKRLEDPLYVCSACGVGTMRRGSTECPFCHVKIDKWT